MKLTQRIRAAQDALGLNQQQIARELSITPEWLSRILKGRVEGSHDIALRLEEFLRRRGLDPQLIDSKTSALALNEDQAPYGAVAEIVREIDGHHAELLAAAKNEPARLGWIREQQQAHLAIPAHWRSIEDLNRRARELADEMNRAAAEHRAAALQATLPERKLRPA